MQCPCVLRATRMYISSLTATNEDVFQLPTNSLLKIRNERRSNGALRVERIKAVWVTNSSGFRRLCFQVSGSRKRGRGLWKKRDEECREQPGEEVNGRRSGNSGGEVGPLGFFHADCPTRLISQCTLQRPASEFETDSHSLLITWVLTLAVRLFPPFI